MAVPLAAESRGGRIASPPPACAGAIDDLERVAGISGAHGDGTPALLKPDLAVPVKSS